MVQDFWNLDQSSMSVESIISKAKEYYAEDFIECYDKWKATLDEANTEIFSTIQHIVPKDQYIPMTFDYLCSNVINKIEETIKKNGKFVYDDIMIIINEIYTQIAQDSLNAWDSKKNTLDSLMLSIKKVVASERYGI